MSKTYYTVEPKTNGYQIVFLDQRGQQLLWGDPYMSVPSAMKSFERDGQPGAVFLAWSAFCARVAKIEAEREKIVAWNARAAR